MSHPNNDNGKDKAQRENIFKIMDGIIAQLNKTKKMFIFMILTIMIIPPITFALTFELLGPPHNFHDGSPNREGFDQSFNHFRIARHVPLLISLVWLGIGIWQWVVLSKWSKKYKHYKEVQKRIDKKLDFDSTDESPNK